MYFPASGWFAAFLLTLAMPEGGGVIVTLAVGSILLVGWIKTSSDEGEITATRFVPSP